MQDGVSCVVNRVKIGAGIKEPSHPVFLFFHIGAPRIDKRHD